MPHPTVSSWAPRAASACAVLVGGLATIGWVTGHESLMRLGPGVISIKPLSAAAFIALGIALWLMAETESGGPSRAATTVLGGSVAGLGLLTLAEYVFGWNAGHERLLWHDRAFAEHVEFAGRMSASAAIAFVLLGSAAVLARHRRDLIRTFQALVLAAAFLALFAVVVYLFDASVGRPWMGNFTPLTPSMALVFISLSLGMAVLRPDAGLMLYITTPGPGGTMARTLLPIAVAMPILLSWAQLVALRRGWESFEMIVTFRAMVIILVLVTFIWMSARASFRQHESRIGLLQEAAAGLAVVNAELDAFARTVSHDLRAPVRAVDGFAQLLEEEHAGQLDAEGRRLLRVVRTSSLHMGHLIDDLLAFSRISRQTREPVRVGMHEMAGLVAAEACAAEPGRAIQVEMGPLPDVDGDRSMLRQVWANLLSNAVKYTRGQSAALIRVTGEIRDGFARYAVSDNGSGYDPRYQNKLFGVFQRLHSAEEFEGTGVGLALVKRIVERHGGSVGAEGRVGQGATFSFTLPLVPRAGVPA